MTAPHITDAEIAELRRLEAAATPGPWTRQWNDCADPEAGIDIAADGHGGRIALVEWSESDAELFRGLPKTSECSEADLIVAARNALPRLLAEIERLRAELRKETP